jgi:hypothetical protein
VKLREIIFSVYPHWQYKHWSFFVTGQPQSQMAALIAA